MPLFDAINRTDARPAFHEESEFAFLNRRAGRIWDRTREKLETYFDEYPAEGSKDLRSRFRSDDRRQHTGAWWELYVYTLYSKLGFSLTVHPEVENSSHKPDFLAARGDAVFYLEATVAFSGKFLDDNQDRSRDAWMFDLTNEATHGDYHVGLDILSRGIQRPARREIVEPLEEWLEQLDYDVVALSVDAPEMTLRVRGWELVYTAHAVRHEFRGEAGRLLGLYPVEGGLIDDEAVLRKSIRKKINKYGRLKLPLIVAVMATSNFLDGSDFENALFGSKAIQFYEGHPDSIRWIRVRDGVWTSERGPRGTNLSAVLAAEVIQPWTHAQKLPTLWVNPWANAKLIGAQGFAVGTVDDEGAVFVRESEMTAAEVFELEPEWPNLGDARS